MTYKLAFSPCPNDTFIFDALVNKKIDTEGFEFAVALEDVQTLNQLALSKDADFTKISYGVYPLLQERYSILNSGSALGRGVGPLLISNGPIEKNEVSEHIIAIPGENTTAHLLFSLAFPQAMDKRFMRYDQIEDFVSSGNGLGVIIHENRFTYEQKNLHKIIDLGDYWEKETGYPIPLGGIVANKKIDPQITHRIDRLIKKSIEFSFKKYPEISDYVRQHSQEMEDDVMRKHIDLYVNDFSLDLGERGNAAIEKLVSVHQKMLARKMPLT